MDKLDAVIVGGGLAGLSEAYKLAEAGRQVVLLERGDAPGSKNVTGGRIYVEYAGCLECGTCRITCVYFFQARRFSSHRERDVKA